jgi:hypothetical protein
VNDTNVLFTLKDINSFDATIGKWLSVSEELLTMSNLFFGSQYNPAKYTETRFLTSAQAAEIYHRLRYKNNVLPKAEHQRQVKTILEIAPQEYRGWLKTALAFSNEPRLLQRLKDLLDLTSDVLLPLVKDKDKFATKVKDTRNYYTHYNQTLKRKAAQGEELHWVNEALFFLLQRCFLHELGFSSEQCVELFSRNRRYQSALQYAKYSW